MAQKYRSVSRSVVSDSLQPHGAHQAPLSMGFSRQEYWSGLPFPSPGYLPNPGIEPGSPALQAESWHGIYLNLTFYVPHKSIRCAFYVDIYCLAI